MQIIKPKLFHMAQTRLVSAPPDDIIDGDAHGYLTAIGAPDWRTDSHSETETLIEIAGRSCYRSFDVDLNKNLTRVREGNLPYIGNILASKHGSVIEHGYDTFNFHGVSRIFTHECVRHRIADYSQESMRFVRLDSLGAYYPKAFEAEILGQLYDEIEWDGEKPDRTIWIENCARELRDTFIAAFEEAEDRVKFMTDLLHLDRAKGFGVKKKLTSAMRRAVPDGICTSIIMTANHRTWRGIIEKRTSRHAEEEIRPMFARVYQRLRQCYPAIYQDAKEEIVEGVLEVTFAHNVN